jgi:hypothetical protein
MARGPEMTAIYVWRSERHGGDMKTRKSRRTIALPQRCVVALREYRKRPAQERLYPAASAPSVTAQCGQTCWYGWPGTNADHSGRLISLLASRQA